MRWLVAGLGLVAGTAASVYLLVPRGGAEPGVTLPESPMSGRLLVGFHDDVSLRWAGDRAEALDRAGEAGATVIRTIVDWSAAAPRRPAAATNPFDPAYELDDVDELARNAQTRGVELLISIWGTPPWANGGGPPNRPPTWARDLQDFAQAIADRYSGGHPGYPAVRFFSAWNEPNLLQFLAPQFDAAGRSVSPALYASIARAVYDGVKRANAQALVAVGETSPRGHDRPSPGPVQDSHSPARFARLLSEQRPRLRFDAWAQHPYPPRPGIAPAAEVRWPRVGMANLERFGDSLDGWFGVEGTPLWLTEYGHESEPDASGVRLEVQARYAEEALSTAAANPRVRMLVWFILRDRAGEPWQSGLIAEDGSPKPAFARFAGVARGLDARNPMVPGDAGLVRLPVLELAFHTPAGDPIEVTVEDELRFSVPLGRDGWIEVPVEAPSAGVVELTAANPHGQRALRTIEFDMMLAHR